MGNDVVIRVEGLWKQYGLATGSIWNQVAQGLPPWMKRCLRDDSDHAPWALRDVSFEVRQGETLGIIGQNGAGKSTLLKVLAGVTKPTKGHVEVQGQVFSMIELNAGLHLELTGRENVFLLGAIMGLSRRKVQAILPEIEDFVELGEWFDRPARTYSSGMLARLGFGVATSIRCEIILIDETFAVGDLKFQNKSLAKPRQMRESGATILLVLHNLDILQYIAQRSIVLDKGQIVATGSASEGVLAYEQSTFASEVARVHRGGRQSDSIATLTVHDARVYGEGGVPTVEVAGGRPFGLEVSFTVHRRMERPLWSIGILNAAGVLCVWNMSEEEGFRCDEIEGRYRLRLWYPENKLVPGAYRFNFVLRDATSFEKTERIENVASFMIVDGRRARGIVATSPRWELSSDQTSHDSAEHAASAMRSA